MRDLVYMRYELLRTFRNKRFFIFTVAFPLILYFVIAGPNRHERNFGSSGIPLALYYMIGLTSFATMMAMISSGARIATERTAGWTRLLRVTPLSARAYFRAKVGTAYASALISIGLLYAAGLSLGVNLPAGRWFAMTGLILVGLLPFAVLGILLGHMLTSDSVGPATGGVVSLLALVSGTWFPISHHGFLYEVAHLLPSYWLVQASHVGLGGHGWGTTGWTVIAAWTLGLAILARWVYRRDTARV